MSQVNFEIGSSYTFNTVAPSILNSEFKNMVLKSIMSASEAVQYIDVYSIHSQIKQLPNLNIPTRASDLHYLKFLSPNGGYVYIAREYLTSVQLVSNKQLVVTINNYTASDYTLIEETMRKLGFENFTCELVSQ